MAQPGEMAELADMAGIAEMVEMAEMAQMAKAAQLVEMSDMSDVSENNEEATEEAPKEAPQESPEEADTEGDGDNRTMSIATTAVSPFQPLRTSSEAPEVVPEEQQPPPHEDAGVVVTTYGEADLKKTRTGESQYQKQVDDRQRETLNYPPTPSDQSTFPLSAIAQRRQSQMDIDEEDEPQRLRVIDSGRSFTLLTTIILVIVAFLLGGGIGGGVGGALFVKEKSKVHNLSTATSSAQPASATVIVDTAGCPLVNNSTYTSSVSSVQFLKLCGTEIGSPAGQSIELSNSTQTSFNACLDSCAGTRGCVGATWVIFSPSVPTRNSQCFLKSGIGVQTSSSAGGDTACSGYLKSIIT